MAHTVNSLIMTSADDCKVSLEYCTRNDLPLLYSALAEAEVYRKKTHVMHLTRRIRRLEKETAP